MMNIVTIVLATLPVFLGFTIYLMPKFDRYLALLGTVVSFAYALILFIQRTPLTLELVDNVGVTLSVDE